MSWVPPGFFVINPFYIYSVGLAIPMPYDPLVVGVFAFSESLNWLYMARFIQGIGSTFIWSAVNTIVADLTPATERGKTLGQLKETTTRGGLIGIFAASFPMFVFPQDIGWKITFTGYGY